MSEGILPEYCSICGGVAGPHAREKVIALNIVGHRAHVCPGYHDSHPPHKYCQKCEQWRDLDGMDCGRCGTTLVLRRLDEHSESAPKYDEAPLRLQEQVFLAIGRASMCWDRTPPGVFDDLKAKAIGEQLIQDIARELNRQQSADAAPKHDGNLDKDYQVEYASEWDIRGVRIHATDPSIQGQEVFLVPHRALSLLDWLRQEEAELQRLEKEQGF